MSARRAQRGFSLVELIVLVGVFAAGAAALLMVFTNSVRGSADPVATKQALSIAQGLLEEVQLNSYDPVAGTGATRADFNDVDDYNLYSTVGIQDINGNPVSGLGAYNVRIDVTTPGLNGVAEAKLITVTVSGRASIALSGYRVKYP